MRVATLALALVAVSSVSSAPLPDNARRSLYANSADHATSQLESRGKEEIVLGGGGDALKGNANVANTLEDLKTDMQQIPDERQLLETLTNTPSRQASFKDHSGTQEKNLERSSSLKQTSGGIGGNEDPNEAVNNKILNHLVEDEAKKGETVKMGKEVKMIPKPSKSSTAIKALSLLGAGGVLGAGAVGVSAAIRYQHRLDRCLAAKDKDKLAPDCSSYIHYSSSSEAAQKRKEFGFPEPAAYRPFGPLRHL